MEVIGIIRSRRRTNSYLVIGRNQGSALTNMPAKSETLLGKACPDIVEILLHQSVDLDMKNEKGLTVQDLAKIVRRKIVIDILERTQICSYGQS